MGNPHIVITGTGRAGTTFLMHLLTELGLETGFSPETLSQNISQDSNSGLEWPNEDFLSGKAPRVFKSPC